MINWKMSASGLLVCDPLFSPLWRLQCLLSGPAGNPERSRRNSRSRRRSKRSGTSGVAARRRRRTTWWCWESSRPVVEHRTPWQRPPTWNPSIGTPLWPPPPPPPPPPILETSRTRWRARRGEPSPPPPPPRCPALARHTRVENRPEWWC